MSIRIACFSTARKRAATLAALALGVCAGRAAADRVYMNNGQVVEGIITDENEFYVTIDVRGAKAPIPRTRVKSVERQKADDNARMLLQRVTESMGRNEMGAARSLIEQAKMLSPADAAIVDELRARDKELAEMEQLGGSPEDRRRRAASIFQRANDAYDRIRIEEGNDLLMQALKANPDLIAAQELMESRLERSSFDPVLAARYFSEVLYPDHMPPSSRVFTMLPAVYENVLQRFSETTDPQAVDTYLNWIKLIRRAIQEHPDWLERATPEQRTLVQAPLEQLLGKAVEANLARKDFPLSMKKLEDWADADNSPEEAMLFARAQIGSGQLAAGEKTLVDAQGLFPGVSNLLLQSNAVTRIVAAIKDLDAGNEAVAVDQLQQVFNSSASLAPEFNDYVGARLTRVVEPKLAEAPSPDQPWKRAENAALVMRFSQNARSQRDAARILSQTFYSTPWNIAVNLTVNGNPAELTDAERTFAALAFADPMAVHYHPDSTFVVDINMDIRTSPSDEPRLLNGLATDMSVLLNPPVAVTGLEFSVDVHQPSLGSMLAAKWNVGQIPANLAANRQGVNAAVAAVIAAEVAAASGDPAAAAAAAAPGGQPLPPGAVAPAAPPLERNAEGLYKHPTTGEFVAPIDLPEPYNKLYGPPPSPTPTPIPTPSPAPTPPPAAVASATTSGTLTADGSTTGTMMADGSTSGGLTAKVEAKDTTVSVSVALLAPAVPSTAPDPVGVLASATISAETGRMVMARPDKGTLLTPQPAEGAAIALISSPVDFMVFYGMELPYFLTPNVKLLLQHLRVEQMQKLLTEQSAGR